jgi:hypothetical protein
MGCSLAGLAKARSLNHFNLQRMHPNQFPATVGLHHGQLPRSKIEVYENYIQTRFLRLSSVLDRYQLSIRQIVMFATLVSYEMFSRDQVGLEADLADVREWMEQKYRLTYTRSAIDVLVRARLIRCSPYPDERISFVHRRFNEYFLAVAAELKLMQVDTESIATDRRDRDALVLYIELASDAEALAILKFCWNEIAARSSIVPAIYNAGVATDEVKLRATYCLRFLVDAFTSSKRHLVDLISRNLLAFLTEAVNQHDHNILRAKIAVEAAGVLNDRGASEIIYSAIKTGNYWVTETAIRAARNVQDISSESLKLILRHILELSDAEILKRRRDYSDVFRLNPSFRMFPAILNARACVSVLQWPIRLGSVVLFPMLYVLSTSAWLITMAYFLVLVSGIRRVVMEDTPNKGVLFKSISSEPPSRILSYLMHVDKIFLFAVGLFLLNLSGMDIAADVIKTFISGFGLITVNISSDYASSTVLSPLLALLLIVSCVSISDWAITWREGRRLCRVLRWRRVEESYAWCVDRLRNVTAKGVLGLFYRTALFVGGVAAYSGVVYLLVKLDVSKFIPIGLGTMALAMLLYALYSFSSEFRRVNRVPIAKFETRGGIDEVFTSVSYASLRGRLVHRIEAHHRRKGSRPSGTWPQDAAPNLGDKASIRLSQLDEIWTGLER